MASSKTAGDRVNVQVAVRVRPSSESEASQPTIVTTDPAAKAVRIAIGPAKKKATRAFHFDRVFGQYSTQREVFDAMALPIVDEVLKGFNCTIFAYGQTGTGKTYTMEGTKSLADDEHAGIVPRCVRSLFEKLDASGADHTVRVSFLELYNEELQDLLTWYVCNRTYCFARLVGRGAPRSETHTHATTRAAARGGSATPSFCLL